MAVEAQPQPGNARGLSGDELTSSSGRRHHCPRDARRQPHYPWRSGRRKPFEAATPMCFRDGPHGEMHLTISVHGTTLPVPMTWMLKPVAADAPARHARGSHLLTQNGRPARRMPTETCSVRLRRRPTLLAPLADPSCRGRLNPRARWRWPTALGERCPGGPHRLPARRGSAGTASSSHALGGVSTVHSLMHCTNAPRSGIG